jgi:hypothetical protein
MTYIKPGDVHSPKRHWQLFNVLFDGGDENHPRAVKNTTVSFAIGRWDDEPALAMRWNGTKANPIGHPQSRGLPTWFIVPDQFVRPILEASDFSHQKLKFALDFLELRRVYFITHCQTPGCANFGEPVLASYPSEELLEMMEKLGRDELEFYCIFCDEGWHPTPDEKKRLAEEMQKGWNLYLEKAQSPR